MTSSSNLELLPPDPVRGLTVEDVAVAAADFDGNSYGYGMHTAEGAARLHAVVTAVEAVLAAGLGRDVAVWTLLGGFARLERDGFGESSDTVVRESVHVALEPACAAAAVEALTDDEVGEVALLLATRQLDAHTSGYLKGLTEKPSLPRPRD